MSGNVYITQVLLKRGNTTAASSYTGPLGEVVIDTGLNTLRIQDGVTSGGASTLATNAQINTVNANVAALGSYANATFGTSSFGNANVAIYIATDATILALQANASTQGTSINSINANLGAFETYANATFGTSSYGDSNVAAYLPTDLTIVGLAANAATQATAINTIDANIGSFYTYANVHFSDSNYSNANIAAYLPTYAGNIAAGNIAFPDNTVQSTGYTAQRSNQLIQSAGRTFPIATDAYGNISVTGTSVHLNVSSFFNYMTSGGAGWTIKDNTGQVFNFLGYAGNVNDLNISIVPYGDPAVTVYFPITVRSADYAEGIYATLSETLNGNVFGIRGDGSIKFADNTVQHTAFVGDSLFTDNGNVSLRVEKTYFAPEGRVVFPGKVTLSTTNGFDSQILKLASTVDYSSLTIRSDNALTGNDFKNAEVVVRNDGLVSMQTYVNGESQYFALDYRGYLIFPGDVTYQASENAFYTTSNIALRTDTHYWKFEANGSMILPSGLVIGNGPGDYIQSGELLSVTADATILSGGVDGNLSQVNLLDTGNVTIRTNVNNTTDRYWNFDTDGILTIPNGGKLGGLQYADGIDLYANGSMSYAQVNYDNKNYIYVDLNVSQLQTPNVNIIANTTLGNACITVTDFDLPNTIRTWEFNSRGDLTLPYTASPSPQYGGGITFGDGSYQATAYPGQTYGDEQVAALVAGGTLETAWFHGNVTVGNLTVNGNISYINTQSYNIVDNIITMADGNPADTLDLGFAAHRTVGGTLQHTGLVRDASENNWKLFSNVIPGPGNTVDFTDAIYEDLVAGNVIANITKNGNTWVFSGNGNVTLPGSQSPAVQSGHILNVKGIHGLTVSSGARIDGFNTISSAYFVASAGGSYTGDRYLFANSVNILDGVNSSIATVGTNLQTLDANVGAFHTYANATFGTSSYGNSNVAAYLPTYNGNLSAGNVVAGHIKVGGSGGYTITTDTGSIIGITPRVNFTSSDGIYVTGVSFAGNGLISNYHLYANGVNILDNVNSDIQSVNANIGSFYTYANATYSTGGGSSYSNTNVAAYLTTATITTTGNISAANIITTGATSGNISGANYVSANVFQVSTGIFWANGTAWSSSSGGTTYTSTGPGNVAIVGSAINLTATGPGAISVGSSTAIPVITTDAYGRVSSTTTAAVVAPAGTLTGTTLASGVVTSSLTTVGTLGNLTVAGNVTAANIVTTGTYGNITGANVISANTVTVSRGITWANGTAYSVGSYSNSNVASYLPTYTGVLAGSDITLSGGEWTGFTPTWYASTTPVSIGDGFAEGRYRILGKTVEVWMQVSMGSTTTFGTGEYKISLPVASRGLASAVLSLVMQDNGTRLYNSLAHNAYTSSSYWTSSNVTLFWDTGVVTNTAPFTWANGDWFIVSGTYEAA